MSKNPKIRHDERVIASLTQEEVKSALYIAFKQWGYLPESWTKEGVKISWWDKREYGGLCEPGFEVTVRKEVK